MNKINEIKQIKKFKKGLKKKTEKNYKELKRNFKYTMKRRGNMTKTVKKNGKFELSAHSPSSPLSRIEALSNSSAFG